MNAARILRFFLITALAFVVPFSAGATLKKEGAWPSSEKKVTFEFEGKPSEGLQALAKQAGWSLVVSKGATAGEHDVHVDVVDQPADEVLEALFVDSDVVAHRTGAIVTVTPNRAAEAPAAAPPLPPATPAVPPVPTVRGEDRNVMGGRVVVRADEVVHTVTVTGGSAAIEGTVTGDLVVMGGSAKVRSGGRVIGDATVFGGSLEIENGGRVDGDVGVVGGSVKRAKGAIIGGRVVNGGENDGNVRIRLQDGQITTDTVPKREEPKTFASRAHAFGRKVTNMALLFVLGSVLLALLTNRMERLRIETASRPMKTFAWGIIATLLGSIATLVLLVVLCITVVGIPLAVLLALGLVVAFYGSMAAVLTTFGGAVLGHKTQNPYAHLLLGCAAFLVLSSIPWIGGVVTFAVAMMAVGALATTRLAGFLERGKPKPTLI